MAMMQVIENINNFVAEAVAQIFSPSDDGYPSVGVQPFSGDILSSNVGLNW